MKKSVCLITGGAGLIGSSVARLFGSRGWSVRVLDSMVPGGGGHPKNLAAVEGLECVETGDIRDPGLVASMASGCQAVFHAAALTSHADSMINPRADLSANVEGTALVLEAVRHACPEAAVIIASTRQIYGAPISLPVSEGHPLNPPDVNGIGKRAAEDLALLYNRIHGLRCSLLRFTNVYGPGMRIRDARQMFLGIWIRRALDGGELTVFGDGAQRRDLLFVDDAAEAVWAALAPAAAGQAFNIGRSDTVTLSALAEQVITAVGAGRVVYQPFPSERKQIDIGDYASDSSKAENMLGWIPRVSLEVGLSATIEYYRSHFKDYVEYSQ